MTITETAATILSLSGRTGFRAARVTGDTIRLQVPAASLNAAEHLQAAGLDATAQIVGGQWAVVVR